MYEVLEHYLIVMADSEPGPSHLGHKTHKDEAVVSDKHPQSFRQYTYDKISSSVPCREKKTSLTDLPPAYEMAEAGSREQ